MNRPATLSVIGWGIFCASSWTWCVGMFLPLIMLLRFGWAGFLVFAIPNVIGCAAFGYMLNREQSQHALGRHGIAATWFSVITIAFHMFFAVYLCVDILPAITEMREAHTATDAITAQNATAVAGLVLHALSMPASLLASVVLPLGAIVGVMLIALMLVDQGERRMIMLTVMAWVVSLLIMIVLLAQPGLSMPLIDEPLGLAALTPVVCFGFLLCPYLDPTFHRARQHTPHRHSFAIFGVAFFIMIVMTCIMWTRTELRPWLQWLIVGHIALQLMVTVALHVRELWLQQAIACAKRKLALTGLAIAAGVGYMLVRAALEQPGLGEQMYLRFLGFYALVLPLYVWVFMTPWAVGLHRMNLMWFALVVMVCAPLYELGFVWGFYGLLLLPAAGFAIWPLIVRQMGLRAGAKQLEQHPA